MGMIPAELMPYALILVVLVIIFNIICSIFEYIARRQKMKNKTILGELTITEDGGFKFTPSIKQPKKDDNNLKELHKAMGEN